MRTSLLYALVLLGLFFVLPCGASSRKDTYRFRNDMPTTEDEDDDGDHHHHHGYTSGVLPTPRCRHNYNERTEAGMNMQINLFMHVGYVYHSMAQYFGRCDVALPGFQKFFRQMAQEQRDRAETLMNYQNLRGGLVRLQQVTAPSSSEWGSGIEAMENALQLEKNINQAMLELNMVALQHEDVHAATYLQTTFLNPQVEKIFTISQYITNLERVGPGLGEYMFDKLPQN